MKFRKQIIKYLVASLVLLMSGCATIVNDPNIPLVVSFSDGSSGECTFKNKRGVWKSEIPTTAVYIRRSDDALVYECSTKDGREVTGSIRSEVEGEKMAASIIFWDLGITDAITDKHRTYQGNVVIPVPTPVPVRPVAPEPEPKLPVLETAAPKPQLEDKIMLGKTDDIISEEKKEWADERISITVERTGDQTAQTPGQKQTDVDKTKIVEEWQTDPEAFAKLFFEDDLSLRSKRKEATFLRKEKESIIEMVNGYHLKWQATFGINPGWLGMSPEDRKQLSKIGDNMALYAVIGPDISGWIWITPDLGAEEVGRWSWGIPPKSDVHVKMKITRVTPIIMKNGMLVIYLDASEVQIETSSQRCDWPEYSSQIDPVLIGSANEILLKSAHGFPIKVGLRSGDEGRDSIVPAIGEVSFFVSDGKYDIYFQYAIDPGSLYQGDSFEVHSSRIEIQLKSMEAGDYKIRKIK